MATLSLNGDKIVLTGDDGKPLEVGSVDYDEEEGLATVLLADQVFADIARSLVESAYPDAEIEIEY